MPGETDKIYFIAGKCNSCFADCFFYGILKWIIGGICFPESDCLYLSIINGGLKA